jgi:hypothetical protein
MLAGHMKKIKIIGEEKKPTQGIVSGTHEK